MIKYRVIGVDPQDIVNTNLNRIGTSPKHLLPDLEKSDDSIVMWVDENIFNNKEYNSKNFGWLTESRGIVPEIYRAFEDTLPNIIDNFNMIFTHSRELMELDDRIGWVPAQDIWIRNPQIHSKSKLVSMITSSKLLCEGHLKRIRYFEKFKDQVDSYGRGFRPIQRKEEGLNDYMFSIAMENSEYSGYFTEKIMDCFATGTIPIYIGDPEIGKVFNKDGIIILDDNFSVQDLSEDLYYSKIDAVVDNFNRCQEFLVPEDYLYKNYFSKIF